MMKRFVAEPLDRVPAVVRASPNPCPRYQDHYWEFAFRVPGDDPSCYDEVRWCSSCGTLEHRTWQPLGCRGSVMQPSCFWTVEPNLIATIQGDNPRA